MERKIAIRALTCLKALHEEIARLPNNGRALLALDGVSNVVENYIVISFHPDERYRGIVRAIIFDWLTNGTGSPEMLVEELKQSIRPVSSSII